MEFIYRGNANRGGIYKITNTQNGRTYYGSCKGFKQRWIQHKYSLEKGKHSNKFLQADFNKCGSDAFLFEVLEVVEGDKTRRLKVEETYLKQHFDNGEQCYNLCNKAISREGYKSKNPEETQRKLSEHAKNLWKNPEHKKKASERMKNWWTNLTSEAKAEMSKRSSLKMKEVARGNKNALGHKMSKNTKEHVVKFLRKGRPFGHVVSEETKKKISVSLRRNKEKTKFHS